MSNDVTNRSIIQRDMQHVFLGTTEIPGIQSVDLDYSNNASVIQYLGQKNIKYIPKGAPNGNVSINSLLITTDQFIGLTGNSGCNGYVFKQNSNTSDNFSFTSGYLTNYTINCALGQIPEINTAISVYSNMGRLTSAESSRVSADFSVIPTAYSTLPLKIASPNMMTLSLGDFSTNSLQNFNLSINIPRLPIYILGQRDPSQIEINYPITINGSFTMDLNDYVARKMKNYPFNERVDNLSFTFNDLETQRPILSYSFNNLMLSAEQYRSNINSETQVTINYLGYLLRN